MHIGKSSGPDDLAPAGSGRTSFHRNIFNLRYPVCPAILRRGSPAADQDAFGDDAYRYLGRGLGQYDIEDPALGVRAVQNRSGPFRHFDLRHVVGRELVQVKEAEISLVIGDPVYEYHDFTLVEDTVDTHSRLVLGTGSSHYPRNM